MKNKVQPSQDNRDPMVKKLGCNREVLQLSWRRAQVLHMPSICQEDGQGREEEVDG
jgi:hypothetical protein